MNPYFPMFVDLSNKKIIIIGGGNIASRRISTLLMFTQKFTVIAPEIKEEIKILSQQYNFEVLTKKYEHEDLYGSNLVIAATNDLTVNEDIYITCKNNDILVNVCSDQRKCDFYFPAVIKKDSIVVGITSSGKNHKLVKKISTQIRQYLNLLQ